MPNTSKERQAVALIALGGAIRASRLQLGFSQEELALRAGLDRGYMGRVERGDNNVTVLTLVRIADALGHTAGTLLSEAGV